MPIPEPSPMSIAIDRAMKAADTDLLVEALNCLDCLTVWDATPYERRRDSEVVLSTIVAQARAVLVKYWLQS